MFTIIIPTYNHEDTIKYAISSVLKQTYQNFEIFVVGDGATERTKAIVEDLSKQDNRITYFENPKGEGHGELYRAKAIEQANGEYIAYLGDDDIWLPNHLETLMPYLNDYDFVQSAQATIYKDDNWHVHAGDLNHPKVRKRMLTERYNFFGPTTVAHRLDCYKSLPFGWRVKPKKTPSDLHMWRQWLRHEPARFKSLFQVTSLHLASLTRPNMTINERCEEMQTWMSKIDEDVTTFYQFAQSQLLKSWNKQIGDKVLLIKTLNIILDKIYFFLFR
ncbi:glycosyltransferase family 2 protein [Paraglaciecola aestuariivivens]